jgi:Protein of unknown function (DUF642)
MKKGLQWFATVAVTLSALPLLGANLIKNGGFEKPVVPIGGYFLFTNGQTFNNWTVVGAPGNVGVVSGQYASAGFFFPAKAGKQWMDLTGVSNTATGIAQTVKTIPGAAYTLTFFVGNTYDPNGPWGTTSTVNVLVNGSQVFTATNSLGQGKNKIVWQKFTTTITASSSQTTISFVNGDPRSDESCGLDSVALTLNAAEQ